MKYLLELNGWYWQWLQLFNEQSFAGAEDDPGDFMMTL